MDALSPGTIEALRGWVSTGSLVSILLLLATFGKKWLDFAIESRKVKMAEESQDRAGWSELIHQLRDEVGQLRDENTALRGEVRALHGMLDGLRRATLTLGALEQLHALEGVDLTPEMKQALDSLKSIHGDLYSGART